MFRFLGILILGLVVIGGLITQAVFESWSFYPAMIWAVIAGPCLFLGTVAGSVLVIRGSRQD